MNNVDRQYVGYIYLTTNLLNGKIYVGMHRVRNDQKDDSYIGSGVALKRAVAKYGSENFSNVVLEWCESEEKLILQEKFWIKQLNSQDKNTGYNMKDGGIGGFNIDVSGANNPMFGIHRYGEDNPNYGNHRTEASRLQQSNSITQNGGHHGEKNPMFGRSHSDEAKKKMSERHKTVKPLQGRRGDKHPSFGFKWWCDGVNPPIKSKTSPGEQYHRGRI